MSLQHILSYPITSSLLALITLPHTQCRIIQRNHYHVYCAHYPKLQGLFRKDIEETRIFGRTLCDRVAAIMKNQGFFTTDERPEYGIRYGISQNEYQFIFQRLSANPYEDLIVLFVYSLTEAEHTKQVFEQLLYEAQRDSILNIAEHRKHI